MSKIRNVFVVCSQRENYFELLDGCRLTDGSIVNVDQAPWCDIQVASYPENVVVSLAPNKAPFEGTSQGTRRTFTPEFVLLRSFVLGNHEHDWRHKMYAFLHHDLPCINSLEATMWSIEKAVQWGRLRRVKKTCPSFPLMPQTYYSHPSTCGFAPEFPCVVKVGSASQGVGKARVADTSAWSDTVSLLSMQQQWFVSEPQVEWVGDVRVQKIGSHYRAIRRTKTAHTSAWKANDGIGISEEDVDVEGRWKRWADACASVLEMDILGLDILQDAEGNEYVLECNGSSIGFPQRHREEDTGYIAEVVLQKLNDIFCPDTCCSDDVEVGAACTSSPKYQDLRAFVTSYELNADVRKCKIGDLKLRLEQQRAWNADDVLLLRPTSRLVTDDKSVAFSLSSLIILLWLEIAYATLDHDSFPDVVELYNNADKARAYATPASREKIENTLELMENVLTLITRSIVVDIV